MNKIKSLKSFLRKINYDLSEDISKLNSKLSRLKDEIFYDNNSIITGLAKLNFLEKNPIFYSNEKEILRESLTKVHTITQTIFLISIYLAEKMGRKHSFNIIRMLEHMLYDEERYYRQAVDVLKVLKMRFLLLTVISLLSFIVYYHIIVLLNNIPYEFFFIFALNIGLIISYTIYWLKIINRILLLPISLITISRDEKK